MRACVRAHPGGGPLPAKVCTHTPRFHWRRRARAGGIEEQRAVGWHCRCRRRGFPVPTTSSPRVVVDARQGPASAVHITFFRTPLRGRRTMPSSRPVRRRRDRDASPPSPPADTPHQVIPGDGWQRRRRRRRRSSPCPYERLSAARAVAAAAGDAAAAAASSPSTRSAMRFRARQRALEPALEGAVVAAATAVAETAALLPSLRREQKALRAAVAAIEGVHRACRGGGELNGDADLGTQSPAPPPLLLPPPQLPPTSPPLQPLLSPSPQRKFPELLPLLPLPTATLSPPPPPPPLWTPPVPSTETSFPGGTLSPPTKPLSSVPVGFDDGAGMEVDVGDFGGLWGESDPASSGDFVDGDGSGPFHVNGHDGGCMNGDGGSGGDGRCGGGAGGGASRMEDDLLDDLLWDTPEVEGWPPQHGLP